VVYSAALPHAWKALEDYIGEPVRLARKIRLHGDLQRFETEDSYSDHGEIISLCGLVEDKIEDRISIVAMELFARGASLIDDFSDPDPEEIWAYGALSISPRYPAPFEVFNADGYRCFGFKELSSDEAHEAMSDQMKVIADDPGGLRIVVIDLRDRDDKLVFVAGIRGLSMDELISATEERIQTSDELPLHPGDSFRAPIVEFTAFHRCEELTGVYLLNKGYESCFVGRMDSEISFTLDEEGADLSGEGFVQLLKCPAHHLVYEPPFLLYLRPPDGSGPYFAAWFGDDSAFARTDAYGG
jgi:hypothetical protein